VLGRRRGQTLRLLMLIETHRGSPRRWGSVQSLPWRPRFRGLVFRRDLVSLLMEVGLRSVQCTSSAPGSFVTNE
jgi:hypothetical protein